MLRSLEACRAYILIALQGVFNVFLGAMLVSQYRI